MHYTHNKIRQYNRQTITTKHYNGGGVTSGHWDKGLGQRGLCGVAQTLEAQTDQKEEDLNVGQGLFLCATVVIVELLLKIDHK